MGGGGGGVMDGMYKRVSDVVVYSNNEMELSWNVSPVLPSLASRAKGASRGRDV